LTIEDSEELSERPRQFGHTTNVLFSINRSGRALSFFQRDFLLSFLISDGELRWECDMCHQRFENKASTLIDAGLPAIFRLIMLLRAERWMMQIVFEKLDLLKERLSHRKGRFRECLDYRLA
jgi:hypothetical protein